MSDITKPTANDFFCVCGGISLGFIQTGFYVTWACDFDKFAVQTYRENVGNHVIQADSLSVYSEF